jgi:DNA-binding response OmpR family regulator
MHNSIVRMQLSGTGSELEGLRLLVVEDDYLVAAELCSALRRRGADIVGPVSSANRGRELVREQRPDCALLDINLNGILAFELASELRNAGIRTIFTTGYDAEFLPEELRSAPCLQKPVNLHSLVQMIQDNADAGSGE